MIRDVFTALIVSIFAVAVSLPIAGCVLECQEPTFADRCEHCGEYIPDAHSAHKHLANCPTRYIEHHSEPEPCR